MTVLTQTLPETGLPEGTMMIETIEPAYLITEAGMDALRNAPVVPDTDEDGAEPEETFTPDTEEKVDWVVGKIADARAHAARIRENMELKAKEADQDAAFLEWKYGAAIQAWVRQTLAENRRVKKSVRLPNGVIGFRNKPATVSIGNEAEALVWASEHLPAAIVPRLDKKALSEALLESGEVVPFALFAPAQEQFYIK